MTFGFDTAVSIATEALDRIATTAESHNRIMVVEVMGRTKGWIATYAGIAAGADAILVPEVEPDLDDVADDDPGAPSPRPHLLDRRRRRGLRRSARAGGQRRGRCVRVRAARRRRLPRSAPELERLTGFETRVTVLGHLQRGGTPTAFDRVLATRFGVAAVDLAAAGRFGEMAALRGTDVIGVPLAEACARGARRRPGAARRRPDVLRLARRRAPQARSRSTSTARCCGPTAPSPTRSRAAIAAVRAAGVEVDRRDRPLAPQRPRDSPPTPASAASRSAPTARRSTTSTRTRSSRTRPLAAPTAHVLVRGLRERFPGIVFGWEHELRFGSEPAYEALRTPEWWPRPQDAYAPCDPLDVDAADDEADRPAARRRPRARPRRRGRARRRRRLDDARRQTRSSRWRPPASGKEAALAGSPPSAASTPTEWSRSATTSPTRPWSPGPGHGVAVANAHPAVIAVADEVCASNDDDGVAQSCSSGSCASASPSRSGARRSARSRRSARARRRSAPGVSQRSAIALVELRRRRRGLADLLPALPQERRRRRGAVGRDEDHVADVGRVAVADRLVDRIEEHGRERTSGRSSSASGAASTRSPVIAPMMFTTTTPPGVRRSRTSSRNSCVARWNGIESA